MMGRPSSFTQEKADAICELLIEGMSLREVCRREDMPEKATVLRWLHRFPDFRAQYATAKEAGIVALAEDILEIADDGRNDWMERLGPDGQPAGWVANGEAARRSQIRIDARKWLLSKMAPKKYGDKVALTGDGGGPVLVHQVSDEQLAAIATSGSR